ncbi:hypothetical protein AGMMS49982_01670 [Bacteroidia bacterium]|nr:hypothetical protein AGMMS49982_01670 [Bacteroidia bacterium]
MRYIKYGIFLFMFAVSALLPTGCINGELDGCLPGSFIANVNIQLVYESGLDESVLDNRKNATLFIFDSTGTLVNSYPLDPKSEAVQILTNVNLKPNSTYNFVVWHNIDVEDATYPYKYTVDLDANTQDGNRFYLPLPDSAIIDATLPFLPYFYGENMTFEFTVDSLMVVEVPVYQQTNEINVTILGLDSEAVADATMWYKFEIHDKRAKYSFRNEFVVDSTDVFYRQEDVQPVVSDSSVSATLHILKLSAAPEAPKPDLTVTDMTGLTIFGAPDNTSLVSLIQASFRQSHTDSLNFDLYHKFDIVIDLKGARGASFDVNDWGKIKPDGAGNFVDFDVELDL